ncbi:putative receptor protein kinase ZmPK1 [Morella rubra]|uniref:Putative receptor protein kinase ZmPK1 n=1 Tax=Morella rubra TaxID=262757 RepID=A0A6A1URR7_9ROSI|nr:putative receptor protein kinase ZmPK1 [Morella rubra]
MDISVFFFLLFLLHPSSSIAFDTLRGLSLSVDKPSENLVSANGQFSAGFFPVGDNAFCFAIWLTKPSVPTVVWMANRDDPVDGTGSQLSILKDGKLSLTNSMGTTVWSTKTAALISLEASQLQLQLLDTGNLVLHHSGNVVIWESFDSLQTLFFPQQTLTRISSLTSKLSEADYSSGYYNLYFDNSNILRLLYQGPKISSIYWPAPWFDDPGQAGRSRSNTSRLQAKPQAISGHLTILNFSADFGLPDAKPMLECPLKAPQQLRQTYENQTVKLLLSFATALGGVEVARIFVVFFLLRTSKRSDPAAQGYLLTTRFKRFTFSELRKAAQGFNEVIGRGAGGTVYKGGAREHRRLVTLMREKINNIGSVARKTWMDEIIDTGMAGNYDVAKMEVLVRVGLQCVAENKDDRPTMSQVVEMLLVDEVN